MNKEKNMRTNTPNASLRNTFLAVVVASLFCALAVSGQA
jgi:hypothetical protein